MDCSIAHSALLRPATPCYARRYFLFFKFFSSSSYSSSFLPTFKEDDRGRNISSTPKTTIQQMLLLPLLFSTAVAAAVAPFTAAVSLAVAAPVLVEDALGVAVGHPTGEERLPLFSPRHDLFPITDAIRELVRLFFLHCCLCCCCCRTRLWHALENSQRPHTTISGVDDTLQSSTFFYPSKLRCRMSRKILWDIVN